ncbi:MAG: CARDB domain-containing protein, partial [Melioribacteraceae bacterium]|nr:CARDB domain-containing protein [Melioribacteraceae bacterium]
VNFGAVELNTTATRDFQINNNSSVEFDVTLEIVDGDNFALESPSEFTLSIGSQRTVTVSFTPDQIDQYTDELLVRVTSVCGTETFTIDLLGEVGEPLPDLVATDLNSTTFESDFFLGTTYSFEGILELDGDVEVTDDFDVEFLVNGVLQNTVRENRTIQPGQSYSYPFEFAFNQVGNNTLTFIVDSNDEIEEINETNNEISITINVVEGEMKVSPNPFTPNNDGFNDQTRFDFSQLANINNPEIKIFSFNGRLVRTFNPDDFTGETNSMGWYR